MRYFSRGMYSGDLSEEEVAAAELAYTRRFEEVHARLPPDVHALLRRVILHDALVEQVRWNVGAKRLCLDLVCTSREDDGVTLARITYQGAMLGTGRVETLKRLAWSRRTELLNSEFDVDDEEGNLIHRLLFWPNEEVTLDFTGFEFTGEARPDGRVRLGAAFLEEGDPEDCDCDHGDV